MCMYIRYGEGVVVSLKKKVLSAPSVQTDTSCLFLMYLFIKRRMLNENWGRGIWIENIIFNVWLFIGVMIFSLLLDMIYGKSTESKNSWGGGGGGGGLHILKRTACIP